jgi:hypothetical protein
VQSDSDDENASIANGVTPFVQPRWQVTDGVAQAPQPWGVMVATMTAALSLAAVSAGFSITGLTNIFVGAFWPVVGMGMALELGKLSAVAWLGRQEGSRALRGALVVLVAVLMGLNAVGAYGFLAKAHIGHQFAGDVAVAGRAADVDARIMVQAGVVADIDRRLSQIDGAIGNSNPEGADGRRDGAGPSPALILLPSVPSRLGRSPACRSRRQASRASATSSKQTLVRFGIWRPC